MTDIVGPANAPNSVTARPPESRVFGTLDTWLKDCSSALVNDGTRITAGFMNGIIGQVRGIIRGNGATGTGLAIVAENNADDGMVLKAVQHLIQRGQQSYSVGSGVPNAIVASLSPALAEYKAGIEIHVRITSDNTGPATLNVNGLGVKSIIHPDGALLAPGDVRSGQVAALIYDGEAFQLMSARIGVLTANRAYYVNAATGSDANSGLSAGTAFATIQKAVDEACSHDLNGYSVTIFIADGNYTAASLRRFVGTGNITLLGNPASPGNVSLNGSPGYAISCSGAGYEVNGLKVSCGAALPGTPGSGLWVIPGGILNVRNIEYGYCVADHAVADGGQLFLLAGVQRIAANCAFHMRATNAGTIRVDGISPPTLALLTPATGFSGAFVASQNTAQVLLNYSSITNPGYAVGQRYLALGNGIISSNGGGASYYPGSIAGVLSTGGQYL